MFHRTLPCLTAILAWVSLCPGGHGGENKAVVEVPVVEDKPKIKVYWETDIGVSGIGKSDFSGWSQKGEADVLDSNVSAVASVEGPAGIMYRFGLDLQRHDFGRVDGVPIPDTLQSYALVVGVDLQLGDSLLARIEAYPGFYGGGDDSSEVFRFGSLNVPVVAGVSYFVNSDLQLMLGVSMNLNRQYPVLPGIGLRWKFAREWVLNGVLPTPRLEYSATQTVTLYAGADFRGETFRVNGDFGRHHDSKRLNDAVADYSQIRVGAGFTWAISPTTTFQMEAGVAPVQDVDYHRADLRMHATDVPPYLDLSLKAKF